MKFYKFLIAFLFQFIGSINAKTDSLANAAVPFQLISPAEFKAISELSDGNPFITQKRLLSSGSAIVRNIIDNIVDGVISPVNITGLDSVYNSILNQPSGSPTQGYPFCAIQSNRNNRQKQRSYDAVLDPASNFGTFSINFFHPGTIKIDNFDEDVTIDELEPDYQDNSKPSVSNQNQQESSAGPSGSNYGQSPDDNSDRPDQGSSGPAINCIVVLKEPSETTTTPPPTTTPAPSYRPSNRPPVRPSFIYPQIPGLLTPQQSLGPYQVVQLPYPPFLGLVGPNWSGPQTFASNVPGSVIPPTFPIWSAISSANKNSPPAPSWNYLNIPSQQLPINSISTHHVPQTSPYLSSSLLAAINPYSGIPASSPNTITIQSNQNSWLRPPTAGTLNSDNYVQQQQPQPSQNYNDIVEEHRSAPHSGVEILSVNKDNRVKTLNGDELVFGTIQRNNHHHKQQAAKFKI